MFLVLMFVIIMFFLNVMCIVFVFWLVVVDYRYYNDIIFVFVLFVVINLFVNFVIYLLVNKNFCKVLKELIFC